MADFVMKITSKFVQASKEKKRHLQKLLTLSNFIHLSFCLKALFKKILSCMSVHVHAISVFDKV